MVKIGGKLLSLFVIGDTHLSQSVDKPMDVFGGRWENYTKKLCENWKNTITDNDTVVIAGDVSWGMTLTQALDDFLLLDSLPGKKILLKGNHDYWWDTVTKMKKFLAQHNITTIDFLYNNSFFCEGINICGTRGWMIESDQCSANDKKIIARECQRLERSLNRAKDGEKIVVLHYPPVYNGIAATPFLDILKTHGVNRCYYGHLHGGSIKNADTGEHFGINFHLVSADAIDFLPINI